MDSILLAIAPYKPMILRFAPLVLFVALAASYWILATYYNSRYATYRETPASIDNLLSVRREVLGSKIDRLTQNNESVTARILARRGTDVYGRMPVNSTAMVNWRPLTVRMTGYLGGMFGERDGVYDMDKGIQMALSQGARAFVFDLDYLEDAPCEPVVVYRDLQGFKRSLNTGSLRLGCESLANRAFEVNYDPVLIILYTRRLPPGVKQKEAYCRQLAKSLEPLGPNHLGQSERGSFNSCRGESILFTSPIANYQKNFIVLTSTNTKELAPVNNPKESLDFWTNARIYLDPAANSGTLGSGISMVPSGQIAYAQAGNAADLLAMPMDGQESYANTSRAVFKIAMPGIDANFTVSDLDLLMNILGVQCVPLDVLNLAMKDAHAKTLGDPLPVGNFANLKIATNPDDPLSFWKFAGWSRKPGQTNDPALRVANVAYRKTNVAKNEAPEYIIPTPSAPIAPSQRTNANGGALMIS